MPQVLLRLGRQVVPIDIDDAPAGSARLSSTPIVGLP
jgi:hypothetical protein